MKTRIRRYGLTSLFLLSMVLASFGSVKAKQNEALNRSLYVPIALRVCEHLTEATLYIGDQRVAALPTERIFQFTYYPNLKRLLPVATEIRVEGIRSGDGSPFIGRLAVDPTAIYTAKTRIELDFERAKKELTYRRDTRYEKVRLLMRCDDKCPRSEEAITTAASLDTPLAESPTADEKP
jgi:hypothetical protein